MLDRATDREISLPQQVCPLALLNSIWGYRINLGKHASPSFSLLFLTPPDEDSVCSQLLCHMSQLRQKCLLGFFSQYFSPVTRFAPGRYTNPINRKPIAPPGQIKTPPPLFPLLSHTPSVTQTPHVLSAASADLSVPYSEVSHHPFTRICSINTTEGNNSWISDVKVYGNVEGWKDAL